MRMVSIIIVSWNTRDALRDCLKSVFKQTKGGSFEAIVIDNASSDGSAQMVKQEFPQVILIENIDNRGFAAANNQGMLIAQGRYILLLNPDTVILDQAIDKTIKFAEENPDAAVIGVRNDDKDGQLTPNCFMFASVQNLIISLLGLHRLFPKNRLFGRERLTWWNYLSVKEVDVVAGCFMLVHREALSQVGGLDERYFMYGEEMDWCWRFKKAGWKVLYYPDARIIHYGGLSASQNPQEMRKELQRSFLLFIERRQGKMARIIARILFIISGIIRLFFWGCINLTQIKKYQKISRLKIQQSMTAILGI